MTLTNRRLMIYRLILLLAFVITLAYLIITNIQTAGNILLALFGFSAVVFIHECGHFFVAKACDIKVEVFSVFIPPVFLGIRRTEQGWRVRILPQFFPKEDDPEGNGVLSFTFGKLGKGGETEYRIGLIPVAGYVKMLGQDDIGADKQVSDPRSFGNKSTGARMAVIAAGVIFNIITAIVLMTGIYMVGMDRIPAVVGGVFPGSPADRAGLQMGDRIVEIGGKSKNLEFEDLLIKAALSNQDERVHLRVQRRDGQPESLTLVAEKLKYQPMVRLFGFYRPPVSLQLMELRDDQDLYDLTGLRSQDRVVAVNGQAIEHYWQLSEAIRGSKAPTLTLTVERKQDGSVDEIELPLSLSQIRGQGNDQADLNHICSLVPRLRVFTIHPTDPGATGSANQDQLQDGDVIVAAANVSHPTYTELRDITTAHADQDLLLRVERTNADGQPQLIDVTVRPRREAGTDRVVIGIGVDLDASHPVIARVLPVEGLQVLPIPPGSTLTRVAGQPVANFYEVMQQLRSHSGEAIELAWTDPNNTTGQATLAAINTGNFISTEPMLALDIPFDHLTTLHKADHLGEALVMGVKRSGWFVLQTYVTIKQLFARTVALKAMSGPVGIAKIAYQAVQTSFLDFLYLLAFISANLAVVNFLPVPVVDGGVFLLLLVERVQGKPISLRLQEAITYAGLALILSLFLYLTYNDIKSFFI